MIRVRRNKYLHVYSEDFDDLPVDAVQVFRATVEIVVKVIGQEVENGKLKLSPQLIKYLEK